MIKKIKDVYREKEGYTERGFLRYYFEDVSVQFSIPLEQFADPIKTKNSSFKSINKSYLNLIFRSDKFTEELIHQMNYSSIL